MAVVPLLRAPPAVPGGSWDQTRPESAAREASAESTTLVLTLLKRPRTPKVLTVRGTDCVQRGTRSSERAGRGRVSGGMSFSLIFTHSCSFLLFFSRLQR